MNFGDILKRTREDAGLNQVELGEKIGISKQTISKYEKGEVLPKIQTLKDIADVLDCSVDYLLGRVNAKNLGVVELDINGQHIQAVIDDEIKKEIDKKNLDKIRELEKACIELMLENKRLKDTSK